MHDVSRIRSRSKLWHNHRLHCSSPVTVCDVTERPAGLREVLIQPRLQRRQGPACEVCHAQAPGGGIAGSCGPRRSRRVRECGLTQTGDEPSGEGAAAERVWRRRRSRLQRDLCAPLVVGRVAQDDCQPPCLRARLIVPWNGTGLMFVCCTGPACVERAPSRVGALKQTRSHTELVQHMVIEDCPDAESRKLRRNSPAAATGCTPGRRRSPRSTAAAIRARASPDGESPPRTARAASRRLF